MENPIVPPQIHGKQSDLKFTVVMCVRNEATDCFERACKRLLNPPIWHELCGVLSASFELVDAGGVELKRLAKLNDYIRIDIPGPGAATGGGYDWVKIEAIDDKCDPDSSKESFGMRVRPCKNPLKHSEDIAHFFQSTATSSFIIQRNEEEINAFYCGRNELPNVEMDKTIDNLRNTIITSGAFAGLSEMQWFSLIKSFLQKEI